MLKGLTRKYSDFIYKNPKDLLFGDKSYKAKLALFTLDPNDCDEKSQYSILSLNEYKSLWDQTFLSFVNNERNDQEANIFVNGKSVTELRSEMFRKVFEISKF